MDVCRFSPLSPILRFFGVESESASKRIRLKKMQESTKPRPKVAIIGAGIGGTTCAYFLNENFANDIDVTLFEMGSVGGRLATVTIGGIEYEAGGSIIHPANKLMKDLVQITGLEQRKSKNRVGRWQIGRFSLNQGGNVIFEKSRWSLVGVFQMIWRYGIVVLYRCRSFLSGMLHDFARVYAVLNSGDNIDDVSDTLLHMSTPGTDNALEDTSMSLQEKLVNVVGLSEEFVNELGTGAVKMNYGQHPSAVHAFVGEVSLAGAQGGLWAVNGGNKKVPERLLELSKCSFNQAKVTSVKLEENGRYTITFNPVSDVIPWLMDEVENSASSFQTNEANEAESDQFDVVVVATPMTEDKATFDFVGLPSQPKFFGRYHRTVATFVRGEVHPQFFGFSTLEEMTSVNFFLDHPTLNSIALQVPATVDPDTKDSDLPEVWKVFSQLPLTETQMAEIFSQVHEVKVADWLAYPHYSANEKERLSSYFLHDGLYYLNAIELAASAMEMSAIAGKNIANAIFNSWCET